MKELREPMALLGAALLSLLVLVAVLAPVLAPYDPRDAVGPSLQAPTFAHLLGTNDLGQDIFSQILWGTRPSLLVGVGAATVAVGVGIAVGVGAGLRGGLADAVAMRVVDVFLALPVLPLLVLIAALVGAGRATLVLVIGLVRWPEVARMTRGQTLSLRCRGYVEASRGFGGGLGYVVRRHLLPALGPLITSSFVNVGAIAVLMEAGLAFLGLGDTTVISWGLMLNRALLFPGLYYSALWTWWVLPAGFAISLAVLGFTFLGVGLEPRFNPGWRRTNL